MSETEIAFFRGINVGGNRILSMKDLVRTLEKLGCEEVRTYIQTGNAVFKSGAKNLTAEKIASQIEKSFGFRPEVMILSPEELKDVIQENPFASMAKKEPSRVHVWLLASKPSSAGLKKLEQLKAEDEKFRLVSKNFYLYAPKGIGKSKLAANVEKSLGVAATARNWNTVLKMAYLVKQLESESSTDRSVK